MTLWQALKMAYNGKGVCMDGQEDRVFLFMYTPHNKHREFCLLTEDRWEHCPIDAEMMRARWKESNK